MEKDIIVAFYFTSGLSQNLIMSKSQFEKTLEMLQHSFDSALAGHDVGINFNHVTHYIAKEKD